MRTHALAVVIAALLLAVAGDPELSAQETPGPTLTLDEVIDMVRVSGPKLSPDGSRVLFVRNELDWDENKRESRIWIVGADGQNARPFTGSTEDRSPEWSPDGRWVSFTRPVGESDKVRQLFVLPVDGGEAVQLSSHVTAVGNYRWVQDSRSILFVANDSLPDEEEAERKKGDDAVFIDEGPSGQTQGSWNAVWKVEVETDGAPHQAVRLTPEKRRVGDFAPSPNGNFLAYTHRSENRRNASHLSEIALLAIASGEEERITHNDAPESQLAWSPDGASLTFGAPDLETWELDQGNLYLYDIPSGEITHLMSDTDVDIRGGYRWHPGGRFIDLVALDRTDSNLYRLDVRSGELEELTGLTGMVSSASFDAHHGLAAFQYASPLEPGDLWLVDLEGGGRTRLTEANPWVADKDLAEPEVIRWSSHDGLEIEGLLYVPEGRRAPGATILEIHGGPAGVFTRGFDSDAQLLLAEGYALLQPNVRGSSGYGDALLRGNMNDIGGGDYHDLMTGVDAIIERGVAHADSLAVKGWSYGGILGGWTITRTDRFKAASLGAMVADWPSEFGAGFNHDVVRWYLGGDPWSNGDHWRERSAYTHLDRITTPTILFHGANDRTDTMEQTMNFFAGLRHLGVEARFILFPREGHGIAEPRHRRTLLIEELRWLHQYVKGITDWQPPERPDPDAAKEGVAVVS